MADIIEIAPVQFDLPADLCHLRVAAYCRVSTEQEKQDSSIKLQEMCYCQMIEENPNWENAGIFSEKATGLSIYCREEFRAILHSCRKGKIDLILTKSISRFGRNTLDILKALRELHELGVDIHFEKENLHDQHLHMLITIYCAFAQAESENMSYNIRWGIKREFQSGKSGYADFVCFGYKRGDDGNLAIDEPDAEIVCKMFEMRAAGKSRGAISDWLYEHKIPSPTGKERWSWKPISKLLRNEKYTGRVLFQKTISTGTTQMENHGLWEQHLYTEPLRTSFLAKCS